MSRWEILLADSAAVLLAIVLALVLALIARRRLLARRGGTFELSVHATGSWFSRGWTLGLGRYSGETLQWFRVFSLAWRPKRSFERGRVRVENRRRPSGAEAFALYSGHVIVCCSTPAGSVELAMSAESLTGFMSWSESAPPGRDANEVL